MPLAWSSSTQGPLTSEPTLTPLELGFIRGPKKLAEDFDAYRKRWGGKLRGKIVLLTPDRPLPGRETALFRRYSDAALADIGKAPEPAAQARAATIDDLAWPEKEDDVGKLFMTMPEAMVDQLIDRFDAAALERSKFFRDEGVAAILMADDRAREGLLAAEQAASYRARDPLAPPSFVVTAEHYGRIVRLVEHKETVRLRLDLKTVASTGTSTAATSSAKFRWREERRDRDGRRAFRLVALGHRRDRQRRGERRDDRGHAHPQDAEPEARPHRENRVVGRRGAGAAGIEGLRRRALCRSRDDGAEAGARQAFRLLQPRQWQRADPRRLPAGARGDAAAVRAVARAVPRSRRDDDFHPEHGRTDHLSFTRVGLPGFQFIQDPLDYGSLTHHTSGATYDHAVPADLMQASAVIASVVYQAANRPERLPRRELPKGTPVRTPGQAR
jgi:hypothetical protein